MTQDGLFPPPAMDTSTDSILGGRLSLVQPLKGHRIGHDGLLLAASVPAKPGHRILELGAGTGGAAFALASRVTGLFLTLVEIDADLARLAEVNARANGLAAHVRVLVADAAARGRNRQEAGLLMGAIDHVMMNPPFHDETRHRASPDAAKARAHQGSELLLEAWTRTAAAVLPAGGTLSLIHRSDDPALILSCLYGRFGALRIRPVHGKAGQPAIRLLVTATKGSRGMAQFLPGIVLNGPDGQPTREAERVLREGLSVEDALATH